MQVINADNDGKVWAIFEYDNYVAVIPTNDLKEHNLGKFCQCAPTIDDNLIVHNSYDGREFFEDVIL